MRRSGGLDIGFANLARKGAPDRLQDAVERDNLNLRREGAKQSGVRGGAADEFHRQFGRGRGNHVARRQPRDDGVEMNVRQGTRGVDDQIAVGLEPLGNGERFEQRRILNDEGVRRLDRLAQADFLVRNAAESDDRRAGPLRAGARERLCA